MATDLTPFLDVDGFQGMFPRTLSVEESALAALLVQAAAQWIRAAVSDAGKDPLDADDPMAQLVTYMVVRDAFAVPGELVGHTSYQRATDDRSEGGTLAAAGDLLDFNETHRRMLGLTGAVLPEWGGCDANFGSLGEDPMYRYQNTPAGPVVIGTVAIGQGPY